MLSDAASRFEEALTGDFGKAADAARTAVAGESFDLGNGDVVIADITSCTNTSNPSVLIAAGLVAQNAVAKGLTVKPWVKTSLAPGSQVVTEYLEKAGLTPSLDKLGFNLVGYGCTTCIGNSGPLPEPVSKAVTEGDLVAVSVLSGNRNFEGRVNPDVRANYLASPPLVVAYALAGSMRLDLIHQPLGQGKDGQDVFLKDIWPTTQDIAAIQTKTVTNALFASRYADVFKGDKNWQGIKVKGGQTYGWDMGSTYVQNPPYFDGMTMTPKPVTDIIEARILGVFGDSITTDHISPAGSIKKTSSPAGQYLVQHHGLADALDFNSYGGARRGNHQVMMRRHLRQYPYPQQDHPRDRGAGSPGISASQATSWRSMTRPCAIRAKDVRWWSSPARNTAPVPRVTGRPRARPCSACARRSPRKPSSAFTAPTWSAWARCRCSSQPAGWAKLAFTGEEIVSIRGPGETRRRARP